MKNLQKVTSWVLVVVMLVSPILQSTIIAEQDSAAAALAAPLDQDTDGDGLPDRWEQANGTNPNQADSSPEVLWQMASQGGTRPSTSLSALPGITGQTAGTSSGELRVSETGAAVYEIAIGVPPGTGAMAPSLGLKYNSQNANGILGLGWQLTGLSEISRVPATLGQDGVIDPVDFDGNDQFALNGQRLALISGAHGTNGAEYRTENESFAKIKITSQVGAGPGSFKVWTKNGLEYEYGHTPDSQFKLPGTDVLSWKVNKITDSFGNYIQFHYTENETEGTSLIHTIAYTGNTAQGLNPFAQVKFIYESRSDTRTAYVGGGKTQLQKRLKTIETEVDGELANRYQFEYSESTLTQRSRLISFQECSSTECLPKTTFRWQEGEPGISTPTVWDTMLRVQLKTVGVFKVKEHHQEGGTPRDGINVELMEDLRDMNGDGKLDRIRHKKLDPSNSSNDKLGVWVALNTGTSFAPYVEWNTAATSKRLRYTKETGSYKYTQVDLQDINGDGLPDQLLDQDPTTGVYGLWVALNTGTQFQTPTLWWSTNGQETGYNASRWASTNGREVYTDLKDMNGDGLPDRVFHRHPETGLYGFWVAKNTSEGFEAPELWWSTNGVSGDNARIYKQNQSGNHVYTVVTYTDLTGDTLPDRVSYRNTETNEKGLWVAINTGTGFEPETKWWDFEDISYQDAYESTYTLPGERIDTHKFIDMNGDRLPDRVDHKNPITNQRGIWVALNTGKGLAPQTLWYETGDGTTGTNAPGGTRRDSSDDQYWHRYLDLKDINGDGLPDRVSSFHTITREPGVWVCLNTGTGFGPEFLWQDTQSQDFIDPYVHRTDPDDTREVWLKWADINGDGYEDYTQFKFWSSTYSKNGSPPPEPGPEGLYIGFNQNKPELLKSVTNGYGHTASVTYKPLTDKNIYTKYTGTSYPYRDVQSPMQVVSELTTDDGVGSTNTVSYHYYGLREHIDGLGFCGFAKIKATDQTNQLITTQTFRQDFPYKSLLAATEIHTTGGTLLSKLTNTYDAIIYANNAQTGYPSHYFPYIRQQEMASYELDGSLTQSNTKEFSYDHYGNPTQIIQTADDGIGNITTNTYDNITSKWHIGRLRTAQVVSTAANGSQLTRKSSYEYDAQTGVLKTEEEEPGTGSWLKKTYTHDGYGNITSVTLTGPTIQSRTDTTQYGPKGRFAIQKTNALGHTETRTYWPKFGTLKTLTGPNGLTTSWSYDGFGRKKMETRADGTQTRTVYHQANGPVNAAYYVRTDTTGSAPVIEYLDQKSRPIRTETVGFNGQPVYTDKIYNRTGQVAQESAPYRLSDPPQWTDYQYDKLGRVIQINTPDGGTVILRHTGRQATSTNPLGQTEKKRQDSQGNTLEMTDSMGNITTYTYDALGHLLSTTDAAGNTITMQYDSRGNRTQISDPDTGTTQTVYNELGELKSQTNAKNQTVTYTYDRLGRVKSRTEPEGTTTWEYDTAEHGIGKIAQITGPRNITETYSYDELGRQVRNSQQTKNSRLTQSTIYDANGRVQMQVYPTGLGIQFEYTANGYLKKIQDANPNSARIYWTANTINSRGQPTKITLGNGIQTEYTYTPEMGRLSGIISKTGTATKAEIQDLGYIHDTVGNLTRRTDKRQNLTETFEYDPLNRLTRTQVTSQTTQPSPNQNNHTEQAVTYDKLGNILSRSDVGEYTYGENGAGPHAVTHITRPEANPQTVSVTGQTGDRVYESQGDIQITGSLEPGQSAGLRSGGGIRFTAGFHAKAGSGITTSQDQSLSGNWVYTYDANGNRTAGAGQTIAYTSFNKPKNIQKADTEIEMEYGADRGKVYQRITTTNPKNDTTANNGPPTNDTTITETLYFGSYERETKDDVPSYRHYISSPTGLVAIVTTGDTHASITQYTHADHLGSVDTITDAAGTVTERRSYDAWGKRRNSDWTPSSAEQVGGLPISYTGHEALAGVGLIDMGGRTYDPVIGRFLQADPFIQAPENSQSFNRYSYVMNNPLSAVDPSGYISIGSIFKALFGIAVLVITGGMAAGLFGTTGFWAAVASGAMVGFAASAAVVLINGGSIGDALKAGLKGGVIGGVTAGMFHEAGTLLENTKNVVLKAVTHGMVGGVKSMLSGGKFEHGFFSGAFTKALAEPIDGIAKGPGIDPVRTAMSAVAGGTGEALAGGKFMNGAVTGAFSRMYNDEFHKWLDVLDNISNALMASSVPLAFSPIPGDEVVAFVVGGVLKGTVKGLKAVRGVNNAFKIAQSGGKHAGFLKNYLGKNPTEINKAINTLQSGKRGINVHLDKIANPSKYVPNWDALRPGHQQSLIRGWQKEVTNGNEQVEILRGILGG